MGTALDWAVAQCEFSEHNGETPVWFTQYGMQIQTPSPDYDVFKPSTDWKYGGALIEREGINLEFRKKMNCWVAYTKDSETGICDLITYGPTLLIAAMRCYVSSKLGSDIDVPIELL